MAYSWLLINKTEQLQIILFQVMKYNSWQDSTGDNLWLLASTTIDSKIF